MALEAKDRLQSMQSWLEILSHKHQIPNAMVKGRNAGIKIINAVANIVNAATKIVNVVVKGRNVEAKDPTVTLPPPVEDTYRKEYVYSRPTVEEETIRNKPARTIAWVSLTIVLFFYCFIGYVLTGVNAPFLLWVVAVAGTVALAVVVAVVVAVPAPNDVVVAVAMGGAGAVIWVMAMAWTVRVVDGGAVIWAMAMAMAWAVIWTGDNFLRKSFSSVHTFLILTGTSNVGLGLGWIVHRLFKLVR